MAADLFADENIRMAEDTVAHDPIGNYILDIGCEQSKAAYDVLAAGARPTLAARCDPDEFIGCDDGWKMPRLGNTILTSVVFLYPSREHAERHERCGGTGLIVGKSMEGTNLNATYLVTCKHVALGSSPVARINCRSGGKPDVFDLLDLDYVEHPSGVDLAVHPLMGHINTDKHAFTFTPIERFVTPELMAKHDIGIGDEVFMVGRFFNMQGAGENAPAARFGNFSHDLDLLSIRGLQHKQECFAVEMRSRTGFSGSPVYVWGAEHTALVRDVSDPALKKFIYLLGINIGYIVDPEASDGEDNTWLNGVLPAWRVAELLDTPKIQSAHEDWTNRTLAALSVVKNLQTQAEPSNDG